MGGRARMRMRFECHRRSGLTASSSLGARECAGLTEHDHVVITGNVTLHEVLLHQSVHKPFLQM
jgi:hypothetical protein